MATSPDPILTSAREVLRRSRDDMRAAIEGLPPEALNWHPVGDDTNSIAVLAHHSLFSARYWLFVAVDEALPDRDRSTEFEATAPDPGELLAFVDSLFEVCLDLVSKERSVDWSALRSPWEQDIQTLAAWALLHALTHLREHVGQVGLTRQLWEQHQGQVESAG